MIGSKYLKITEIAWLVFVAFCVIKLVMALSQNTGTNQDIWMYVFGMVLGTIMYFVRRTFRRKIEAKRESENQ
jgi:amino acid transporter